MKNDKISEILARAQSLGACDKIKDVFDYNSLLELGLSPQGIEFCAEHNFPTLDDFLKLKEGLLEHGVFIDSGDITLSDLENILIVGDTHATINAKGAKHTHNIMLMHGATATINASDYAVLSIANISGKVDINKDNTVLVLWQA